MGSMSETPDRDRREADQERIGVLLRAVEAPARPALHERIARLSAAPGARRRGVRMPGFALAGACAAALAVVLVLTLSGSTAPTALGASKLALSNAQAPAPATLTAAGTRIVFPNWSSFGWPSSGVRRDRLDGRAVTTEFYGDYPGMIGYSIVSGSAVSWGTIETRISRSGTSFVVLRSGRAQVVAWVEDGHTCVLASRTAPVATLIRLAVAQDATAAAARVGPWSQGAGSPV
jgi:hypothetical protein